MSDTSSQGTGGEPARGRTAFASVTYGQIVAATTVVLMAVAMVAVGSSLVAVLTGDRYVTPLEIDLDPGSVSADLPQDATALSVTALVDAPAGLAQRLGWWAVTDGLGLLGLAALELVRRLARSHQHPFTPANVGRLRALAAVMMLYFAGTVLQAAVAVGLELAEGYDNGAGDANLWPVAVAVLILTLTEVWDRGAALQADAELTI